MKRLFFAFLVAGCAAGTTGEKDRGETQVEECTDGVDCPEDCADDVDNDGDGDDNCADDDCNAVCDADSDGYIDEAQGGDDCNDAESTVNPGQVEVCDGLDNDCNGLVDRDDPDLDPDSVTLFYLDNDGDGYGRPGNNTVAGCEPPTGRVGNDEDCDDNDGEVNPAAQEICNGKDDNCDGPKDDDDPNVDLTTGEVFFADTDQDMDGDALSPIDACVRPQGYSPLDTDCDDSDPLVEGHDRDGDGFSTCDDDCDDFDPLLDPADVDGDGESLCDGDCDDNDAYLGPQVDLDADGADSCIDCDDNDPLLNLDDIDLDGWTTCDLDCDDDDPLVEPADLDGDGVSTCDGDCDDDDPLWDIPGLWVPDSDSDGYGDGLAIGPVDCAPPGAGYVPAAYPADCDDSDAAFNPGVIDLCGDGIDHDCDGDDCVIWVEDFENGLGPRWTTWGDAAWFTQGNVFTEGANAAECGNIGNLQDSYLGTQVDFPIGGNVSFYHSGDTENFFDFLEFRIDGILMFTRAGTWNWTYADYAVVPGLHTLEWRYRKDVSISNGADTVWIDDVQMPGGSP